MSDASPRLALKETLDAVKGTLLTGTPDVIFSGICTDSRQLKEGNLFVALKGDNYDGHDYCAKALELGAAGIIISDESKIDVSKIKNNGAVIKVTDTLEAIGDLAHYWRNKFLIPVIGLTGSSGKTTTKEIMAAIIGRQKNILKTEGNLNNLIGLPMTIFQLTNDHEVAILEMGTNTPGEIKRLTQIAAPDIGVITNIGPAHLAGFGSIEGVRKEKGDLFAHMNKNGIAVVNMDDENINVIVESWRGQRISFGMSPSADVCVKKIDKIGPKGMRFQLMIAGREYKAETKIAGMQSVVYNAMAAVAVAQALGIRHETILEGLASFQPVAGRMEIIKLKNGAYLINDSYNANPASTREALMTLKELKNNHNSYAFLGDMLELGEEAREMHRKVGMLAAVTGVNTLFLRGDFSDATAAGATEGGMSSDKVKYLSDIKSDLLPIKENLKKGDWILVKGSRRMKMEKIVEQICGDFGCE